MSKPFFLAEWKVIYVRLHSDQLILYICIWHNGICHNKVACKHMLLMINLILWEPFNFTSWNTYKDSYAGAD